MRPAASSGRRSATTHSFPSPTTAAGWQTASRFGQATARKPRQSFRIPPDAMVPERATGRLVPVGADAAATDKVTYKVLASAFHDGSEMEPADFLYPYALALRWGEDRAAEAFRSGDRGGDGGDARTVQGRARRRAWRKARSCLPISPSPTIRRSSRCTSTIRHPTRRRARCWRRPGARCRGMCLP